MQPVSVVIIAKNEAENIGEAVRSALQISDDVVVADSGSTDATADVATNAGARVVQISWKGFGAAKNEAAAHATYDWIFSLDADERLSNDLVKAIRELHFADTKVYGFRRLNYLYGKPVVHGEWGRDVQYRLYNKKFVQWKNVPVHESLDVHADYKKKIAGTLLHWTMKNAEEYETKTMRYAKLMAEKYFSSGKEAGSLKKLISPAFNFIQNYIFRFGFLDGKQGLTVASMSARYTYLKYKFLAELNAAQKLSGKS